MKTINILIILLTCMLSDSCLENPMPRISYGFINAEVNGKQWNKTYNNAYQATYARDGTYGSAIPCETYITLSSELYNEDNYLRQTFLFIKLHPEKGRYEIVPFVNGYCDEQDPVYANFHTWTSDGDVVGDNYSVLSGEDNFFEIESYNPNTKEMKGKFEVTFVLERQGWGHFLADTLRFKNGRFHTKIIPPAKPRAPFRL